MRRQRAATCRALLVSLALLAALDRSLALAQGGTQSGEGLHTSTRKLQQTRFDAKSEKTWNFWVGAAGSLAILGVICIPLSLLCCHIRKKDERYLQPASRARRTPAKIRLQVARPQHRPSGMDLEHGGRLSTPTCQPIPILDSATLRQHIASSASPNPHSPAIAAGPTGYSQSLGSGPPKSAADVPDTLSVSDIASEPAWPFRGNPSSWPRPVRGVPPEPKSEPRPNTVRRGPVKMNDVQNASRQVISKQKLPMRCLNRAVKNLHIGLEPNILEAPLRLMNIKALLKLRQLPVYESISPRMCLEVAYSDTTEELWSNVAVLSWRWSAPKAATLKEARPPMSPFQFKTLKRLLRGIANNGICYVWIDWCCVPQYSSNPMVEIHRSRLFYGRARQLVVLPDFKPLKGCPVLRCVLHNASRELLEGAANEDKDSLLTGAVLDRILQDSMIASCQYFGRVWTLAERMARAGRREEMREWLPLDIWLGMVVDAAMSTAEEGGSTSSHIYWQKLMPPRVLQSLREVERELQLAARVRYASEALDATVASLCRDATLVWKSNALDESAEPNWLARYLTEEALCIYRAWNPEDAVWSVYGYFCWRDDAMQGGMETCMEALSDLCLVARVDLESTSAYKHLVEHRAKQERELRGVAEDSASVQSDAVSVQSVPAPAAPVATDRRRLMRGGLQSSPALGRTSTPGGSLSSSVMAEAPSIVEEGEDHE